MQPHERGVHKQHGAHRLYDADHGGASAGLLELAEAELVADIEGDKAQSHVGEEADLRDVFHRSKADARQLQPPQAVRPHQNAGHQKGGHVGQLQFHYFEQTGHHQTREQRHGCG